VRNCGYKVDEREEQPSELVTASLTGCASFVLVLSTDSSNPRQGTGERGADFLLVDGKYPELRFKALTAEHNCGRLIDKEFGRRKSGET